jgi:hypothetical protein
VNTRAGKEAVPASRGDTGPKRDPAQYILEKLKIADVHRMVRGHYQPACRHRQAG